MSGSPRPPGSFNEELLFADDIDSPIPGRPLLSPQPIGKKSSAVAPSDRKLGFFPAGPGRAEHVAIRVVPPPGPPPAQRFKLSPAMGEHVAIPVKLKLGFYDPTGRKLQTNKSAFRINPDAVVRSPLRKGEKPAPLQGPYMPGGRRTKKAGRRRSTRRKVRAYRSRKVSRPSTRRFLRR